MWSYTLNYVNSITVLAVSQKSSNRCFPGMYTSFSHFHKCRYSHHNSDTKNCSTVSSVLHLLVLNVVVDSILHTSNTCTTIIPFQSVSDTPFKHHFNWKHLTSWKRFASTGWDVPNSSPQPEIKDKSIITKLQNHEPVIITRSSWCCWHKLLQSFTIFHNVYKAVFHKIYFKTIVMQAYKSK